MRPYGVRTILTVGVLAIVVIFFCTLLGCSWVGSSHREIDINSGDIRHRTYICSLCVRNEIEESPFSQEVRRLQIAIPRTRTWKRVSTRFFISRRHIDYTYGPTIAACNLLVETLTEANISDEQRRDVLQRFLAVLPSATSRIILMQLNELLEDIERIEKR